MQVKAGSVHKLELTVFLCLSPSFSLGLSLSLFFSLPPSLILTPRFSLNSELHDHSLVTVIGGEEEHFEDFGESNTSELLETNEGSEGEGEGVPSLLQTPDQVDCSSLLLSPRYGATRSTADQSVSGFISVP